MANTTISMSKIRKILRMYTSGRSIMSISAQADASRNTVKKYLAAFKESGFTFEEVNALDDKELEDLFGKTIADAILDRIVHSAHRLELKGESMRKKRKIDEREIS